MSHDLKVLNKFLQEFICTYLIFTVFASVDWTHIYLFKEKSLGFCNTFLISLSCNKCVSALFVKE